MCGILGTDATDAGKHVSQDDPGTAFSDFDTTGAAEALAIDEDIKSDIMADVSCAGPLPPAESIIGLTVASHAMSVLPVNGDIMWQMAQAVGQSPPVGSLSNNHLRAALNAPAPPAQLPPTYLARRRRPARQRSPARFRSANRTTGTPYRLKPPLSGTDIVRELATVTNSSTSFCPPLSSIGAILGMRNGAPPATTSAPGTPTISTDGTRKMAPMGVDEKPPLQQMSHSTMTIPRTVCGNNQYTPTMEKQLSMPLPQNTHPSSPPAVSKPDVTHMTRQPFLTGDAASQAARPHSQPCVPRDPFSYEMFAQGAPTSAKSHSEPCTPQSVVYENMPNFVRLQTAREHADSRPGPQPLPLVRPRSPMPGQKLGSVHQSQPATDRSDIAHRHLCPDLRPSAVAAASMTTNTLTYGARAPNTEVAMSRQANHPLSISSASVALSVTTAPTATAPGQTAPASTVPSCPQTQQWPLNCTTHFQTAAGPPPSTDQSSGDGYHPPPFDALSRAHCLPPPPHYPPMYAPPAVDGFVPRFAVTTGFVPAPDMRRMPPLEAQPHSPEDMDGKMSTSSLDDEDDDDDDSKPSESTKKIIQALTEKIRRNQQQRQTSGGHDVSFLEINDIIHNSIDGRPPGGATAHGDVMMSTKMESPQLSPQPVGDARGINAAPPWPTMPDRSPAVAFQQWAKTTGAPFGHPLPPGHSGQTLPDGTARGSVYNAVDLKRVVVIKPQTYQQNGSVRSPDSGFNENCISPSDGARTVSS